MSGAGAPGSEVPRGAAASAIPSCCAYAVGLTRHDGQGIALIGAVLLAWAAFDALAGVRRAGDADDD
jgi:hypothetical protein